MIQQIIDVEEEEEFNISKGQEETKQEENWKTQTAERGKQEWDQQTDGREKAKQWLATKNPTKQDKNVSMIESDDDEGEDMVTGVKGKQKVDEIIIVETGIDVPPSEETTVQVLAEYDKIETKSEVYWERK